MKSLPVSRRRLILACAVLALAVAFVVGLKAGGGRLASGFGRAHSGGDFVAFYCAGKAADSGMDPYRVEPLRTCEHSLDSLGAGAMETDVTPAPLPAYTLALFGVLARLPYALAQGFWYAILLACLTAAAWSLTRITRLPWYVVLAALAIPFAYVNFVFAQLPPVAVAALCVAAYFAYERKFAAAGVAAACAMIEPHIGLPACLAMLAFLPSTRLALLLCGGALALISVLELGIATNLEYFTAVLPTHALAEAGASDQLSLTWLLHWFGASDHAAVLAGSVSYLVLTVAGIYLARAIARTHGADHVIVLLPPAAAMLGGAFVHNLQYAAMIPAALALAALFDTALAWTAVATLSMPWQGAWHSKLYLLVASVSLAIIAWYAARHAALRWRAAIAGGAVIAFTLVTFGLASLSSDPVRAPSSASTFYDSLGPNQTIASALWGVRMRTEPQYALASLQTFGEKLPPWTGALLLLAVAAAAAAARRREPAGGTGTRWLPAVLPSSARTLIALLAANLAIVFVLAALLNIDTDEAYTIHTTSGSLHYAIAQSVRFEFQPPLYFTALWAWRLLDQSIFFGRLFSTLCIALTIVATWSLSRRIAPATSPAYLTAAVALNPFTIWCAVEMRVYALVMLLSTLLLLLFFDGFIAPQPRRLTQATFGLVAIAAMYTFYFSGFLLFGFGAALLALRRWGALAAYAVVSAGVLAAFSPLALLVKRQASASVANFGMPFSFASALALLGKVMALAAMPIRWAQWNGLWLLLLVALIAFGVHIIRSMVAVWPPRPTDQLVGATCALVVACLAFAAGLTYIQQPLAIRYVAFLFVPFVACGYAAFAIFNDYVRRALARVALGLALFAGLITLLHDYGALAKTGDWQRVATYVMSEERPDEPILVFQAEAVLPLTFYYRGQNQIVPVPRALNMRTYDLRELALTSEDDVAVALDRVPGPHRVIWVVTTDYCNTGSVDYHCALLESYLARHYVVTQRLSFYKSTVREFEMRGSYASATAPHHTPDAAMERP
jgi:hypothetical protein